MSTRRLLEQISWFSASEPAPALRKLAVDHGFAGINQQTPKAHHVHQVHGVALVEAGPATSHDDLHPRPDADGLWTRQSGRAIAAKSADCVPLIVATSDSQIVAAVHAGWRGLVAGMISSMTEAMECLGYPAASLHVAVGPAIGLEAFEVGDEVVNAIAHPRLELTAEDLALVLMRGPRRWHVDLQTTAALCLVRSGVHPSRVSVLRSCTRSNPDLWHSFRRDGDACGSNWSWISRK